MKKIVTSMAVLLSIVVLASSSSATPQEPKTNYWTSVCCSAAGNCQTGQVVQNGTPCWCNTPVGPVGGNAC